MRIIENLVHNFPILNTIDPYFLYPIPMSFGIERFFDYFFAVIIWIVGLGSPTQHTIDLVGAYLPAILGALAVVPVYFLGKALMNRWVGVIAAGLIAFSPGEFLGRSILGQADHHVFEVLCSTTAALFILLALQHARRMQLSFHHLKNLDWAVIGKPLIYSVLAGIVLGIYLNSWLGALLFIFIFFIYFVIQFIIDYARGTASDYVCFVGAVTFFITLILTLLLPHAGSQIAALIVALIAMVVVGVLSRLLKGYGIKAGYYLLILIGLGLAGLAIFYVIKPDLLKNMLASFSVVMPTGARLTIEEAAGILFPGGEFSLAVVWLNFTTGSFLALIALVLCIYAVIKKGEPAMTLLVIWSLIILLITLSMRRFAYYFAVNVAVLTAYVSWLILQFFGFKEKAAQSAESADSTNKKARQKKIKKRDTRTGPGLVMQIFGVVVVFFLVLFPNIMYASDWASFPQFTPSDAWCESLDWLRENTPEPYGTRDYYYEHYETPFTQPDSAYGVAAQWDYGYWITRLGHRSPICNPGIIGSDSRGQVARYFLAQDEASAVAGAKESGYRYIIMDYDTATPISKYYSWLEYAGIKQTQYYDVYVQRIEGNANRVLLYYPEYYRSLAIRLYNFDGSRVTYQESSVISYEERTTREGLRYKEITSLKTFPSYDEAMTYLKSQKIRQLPDSG